MVHACPAVPRLEQFLLGQVSAADGEELEAHLATCARCAETLRSLHVEDPLVAAIRGPDDTDLTPHRDLIEAVLPLLKRMKPREETVTQAPGRAADALDASATLPTFDFLAPPQAPEEVGRLGSYRVLRMLGSGGMGVVFLADDPLL